MKAFSLIRAFFSPASTWSSRVSLGSLFSSLWSPAPTSLSPALYLSRVLLCYSPHGSSLSLTLSGCSLTFPRPLLSLAVAEPDALLNSFSSLLHATRKPHQAVSFYLYLDLLAPKHRNSPRATLALVVVKSDELLCAMLACLPVLRESPLLACIPEPSSSLLIELSKTPALCDSPTQALTESFSKPSNPLPLSLTPSTRELASKTKKIITLPHSLFLPKSTQKKRVRRSRCLATSALFCVKVKKMCVDVCCVYKYPYTSE